MAVDDRGPVERVPCRSQSRAPRRPPPCRVGVLYTGREKLHYLNPVPFRLVHDRWVSKFRAPIAAALSNLKTRLEDPMVSTFIYEVFIRTTADSLWRALTDGDVTRTWFFGEAVHSDWRRGSSWHSIGPSGARDVEGEVIEANPPHRLVLSWHILYDADLKDELSRVTYAIDQRGDVCKLTVTHEMGAAPKTAKHVTRDGWTLVMSSLKTLLETGAPMPMPAPGEGVAP